MSIDVLSPGPMVSVQDMGRFGLRHMGVSPAGPIDRPSMSLANALVGNLYDAAVLEFAGPAGSFRSTRPVRFAVAGAMCSMRIDQRVVLPGESHLLLPGEILTIGVPDGAIWAYLAFSGGIETPTVLGSRSTHLRNKLGGRALQAGDTLPLGVDPDEFAPCLRLNVRLKNYGFGRESGPIRIVPGPQDDYFAPEVFARLTECDFTVSPQRDRMAMVLGNTPLPAIKGHDIVSDGTVPGSVQVPGSGNPLVLLAESQTTGGYPKIGTVASADLARLAQMPVDSRIRFAIVTRDEAEDLWLDHQRRLRQVLAGLIAKPLGILNSEYLLSCDLVGGIFDPEEAVRPVTLPGKEVQS